MTITMTTYTPSLHFILLVLAVIFFFLEAVQAAIPKSNKVALGLFFFALSFLVL